MTTEQEEPVNNLREEDINKAEEFQIMAENPTNHENMRYAQDLDKLGELKTPPRPKKWFQKQFGFRKKAMQMDFVVSPQRTNTTSLRRSSSLPDLASMLDAASLEKHGVCVTWTPGPLKTAKSRKRSRMTGSDSTDYLACWLETC